MKSISILFCVLATAISSAACAVSTGEGAPESSNEAIKSTTGGGGGLGFACGAADGYPGQCSCAGPADSVDCQNMKKNCTGPITCGWLVDNCLCSTVAGASGTGTGKIPPVGRVPVGTYSAAH